MRVRCNLRTIRAAMPRKPDGAKISLRDIQDRCGISPGQLSMLEAGKQLPADKQIGALEEAYGCSIDTWYEPKLLLELEHDPEDD